MERQFATFYLNDTLFGVDILAVNEINRQIALTPVAGVPPFVLGLLNLRGQIVTVIDAGIKLGLGPRQITPHSRCVVLKTSDHLAKRREKGEVDDDTSADIVGLMVDRIGDMARCNDDDIDTTPANVSGVNAKYIAGIVQMKDGLLAVLRLSQVLANEPSAGAR